MSGIAGFANLDGTPVDPRLLRHMTEWMSFRGPEALEVWSDGAVGLGHALLRTTAESGDERQPRSLDGQVWITADARVDGRAELIRKLQSNDRCCSSATPDAELILHAYHVWGEQCLEQLRGDFTFAIWDGRRRRLWCARDHFGVKPFYYASVGGSLVFSNTLDCVRLHPRVSDRLNDLAIADFLLFGYNQEPGTTSFADIERLPPAHTLTWAQGIPEVRRYWTLPVEALIRYKRPAEYVEHFLELLREAVEERLRTGRVGVLMSGGLDSTSVAAIAQQVLAGRGVPFDLRAYTTDYRPLFADEEGHYAGLVASKLGIPIQYLSGASCAPYDRWDRPELRQPEPTHEPFLALQYDQFRQVAEHSRVALSGDGGDNLLEGQSWPYLVGLYERRQFGRLVTEVGRYVLSHGRIPPLLGGFRTRLRRWLGRQMEQPEYPRWLEPSLEGRLQLPARWERLNKPPAPVHPVHPRAYDSLVSPFWPSIFECQDPGVTHVPVEVRAPFFSLPLVRYLLSLPPLPWPADKELLRVAMRGVLPEPVRRRPKTTLAGDPLAEHFRHRQWRPERPLEATPALARYAALERLPPIAETDSSEALWFNLRATSLNYWLKYAYPFSISSCSEAVDEARHSRFTEETVSQSSTASVRHPR